VQWLKRTEKIFNLKSLNRDDLLYRVMPHFLMEIFRKYFRLKVEGLDKIPKKGKVLIIPNHSGYAGFDAVMLSHTIHKGIARAARVLTHHLWFITKTTSIPMSKLGFIEATTENGLKYLKKNQVVVLFPEGEYGNFKETTRAYRLQEFKRGFIRMALETGAPIVPTIIVGAEETHINLKQLKFTKYLKGVVLPLPLNTIPLPAKWKIKFLDPIYLPYGPEAASDKELVHEIAQDIRENMQKEINKEIQKRKFVYL